MDVSKARALTDASENGLLSTVFRRVRLCAESGLHECTVWVTDGEEARELQDVISVLEERGFEVEHPSWVMRWLGDAGIHKIKVSWR